jgi:hypothetical protein
MHRIIASPEDNEYHEDDEEIQGIKTLLRQYEGKITE